MFDPRKQTPNIHNHILDPVTTLTNSYDSWEPLNFDFQVSQKLGNNQFRVQKMKDHDNDDGVESGDSSPPLWQNSPPRSPVHPINYRSLSPSSRTQAIARGQCELMEMVKNMPESCFELSLKDLVEHPKSFESQENCFINKEKNKVLQNRVKIKKNDEIRKAKMMRSKSIENGGLYLKMVSPVSLRSNKKKNKKNLSVNITRVSPKLEECENSAKSMEKEWWKKRFSGSSTGSSNNNGSTGSSSSSSSTSGRHNSNRKRKGILRSCWTSLCFSNTSISAGDENNKVMTDNTL